MIALFAARHNGGMLRVAIWMSRTTGLAVVGLLTFLAPPTVSGGAATQVVTYTVICASVALWALVDVRPRLSARAVRLQFAAILAAITAAACLGSAAGGGGDSMIAFGMTAMMSSADVLSVLDTVAVGALGVLMLEIGGITFDEGLGTLLGYPLLLVVGALVGRNRASYRVQAEQARLLLEQHELLRAEQRRADVLDERTRIAREIHDVLAHSLGALSIQLQTVKALFTVHDDPERALEALAKAQRMAVEGLTETRRAVHALRTDTQPLHDELARTAAEHAERHHIIVRCETFGESVPVPPEATVAMLRMAQESLVNAVKHAPGADIAVRLDYLEDGLRLTVANPLAGAEAGAGAVDGESASLHTVDGGYGLTGMRERLRLLHGNLQAGSQGGRWVVEAEIPLTPAPASQKDGR